jgi:hypothetical protein
MSVMPWVLEAAEKLAAIREAAEKLAAIREAVDRRRLHSSETGYFACVATMDASASM